MKYKQITQCSKLYKYGRNEKFKTREEAEREIKELKQEIATQLSLLKIYNMSEIEIAESENVMQLLVKVNIPQLFDEN